MKLILFTICVFLSGALISVSAQTDYILQDEDVIIDENGYIVNCFYDYLDNEQVINLIIPEVLQGIQVKGIGDALSEGWGGDIKGLFQHKQIISLNLPSTLKYIGDVAFYDNLIERVVIPASVRRIEFGAFYNNRITEVVFEENSEILYIGKKVFYNNTDLSNITLPSNHPNFVVWKDMYEGYVTSPYEINNFLSYYLADVKYTLQDDDVVVNEDGFITACSDFLGTDIVIPEVLQGKKIRGIECSDVFNKYIRTKFNNRELFSVDLPSSIEYIGNYAFAENFIESISLPFSLKEIGDFAFTDNKLKDLVLTDSLVTIGNDAFSENLLISVSFSKSLKSIGRYAFYDNELQSLDLPNSLTFIGNSAFSYNRIDSIDIPPSLTEIKAGAFSMNHLPTVIIPSSVVKIEWEAFKRNRLESVVFEEDSHLLMIERGAFTGNYPYADKDELEGGINSLNSIILPESHKEGCEYVGWTDNDDNFYFANLEVSDYTREYKVEFNPLQTSTIITLLDEDENLLKGLPITLLSDSEECILSSEEGFSAISDAIGVVVMKNLGRNEVCTVNINAQGYQSEKINVRSGEFTDVILYRQNEAAYLVTFIITDGNNNVLEGVQLIIDGITYTTDSFGKAYLVNQQNGVINYLAIDTTGAELEGTITVSGSNVVENINFISTGLNTDRIESILLYPNPTRNKVTIESTDQLIDSYTLFNIEGKAIFKQSNIDTKQVIVNLSNYDYGIYFMSVRTKNGTTETLKLFKK